MTPEERVEIWRIANAEYDLEKEPCAVSALVRLLKMLIRFHTCAQEVFDTFEEACREYETEFKLIKIIFEKELKHKKEDRK